MADKTLKGIDLYHLFVGALKNLRAQEDYLNSLNVFPVPDGDTGKNMVATLSGGIESAKNADTVCIMMKTFSKGCLFTARGNSGVILSQFISGIAFGLNDKDEISPVDFAFALRAGYEQAYKAVVRPIEGTMLTVMRESAEALIENIAQVNDFESLFNILIPATQTSLNATPTKLEVLKDAGVVDSGGAGILCLFEGMALIALNKEITAHVETGITTVKVTKHLKNGQALKYGYCTEFILQIMHGANFELASFIHYLETLGNSVVAVKDDDIVKVHVHTLTPEKVLAYAHDYGEFLTLKIENMDFQELNETSAVSIKQERKKFAVVSVASGSGIKDYFTSIGADAIINGGQTENPSAQDFLDTFDKLNAENIIVLPNNKNIILTAKQASELYEGANVFVIETKSVAEGYSALSMIDVSATTIEHFIGAMQSNLPSVKTGYVAMATKNACVGGIKVKTDEYVALIGSEITATSTDKNHAVLSLLSSLDDIDDKQTIIVFTGADVTEHEKED